MILDISVSEHPNSMLVRKQTSADTYAEYCLEMRILKTNHNTEYFWKSVQQICSC